MLMQKVRSTLIVVSVLTGMTYMSLAQTRPILGDPEAYTIYSLLLAKEGPVRESRAKKPVIIGDTQNFLSINYCLEREPSHDPTIDSLALAYREVNKSGWQLQPQFDLLVPYEFVTRKSFLSFFKDTDAQGWKEFYDKHPDAGAVFFLSAIAFDKPKTRALVYVGYNCGFNCGKGRYHLLEKQNGTWSEISFMPTTDGCGVVS